MKQMDSASSLLALSGNRRDWEEAALLAEFIEKLAKAAKAVRALDH